MKSRLLLLCVYAAFLLVIGAVALAAMRDMQVQTRGVAYGMDTNATSLGVNVALEQYSDADLVRALGLVRQGGFSWVRQHFYWSEIEPRRGEFVWDPWDHIVARASDFNLSLLAVIDTTPVWARHPGEADLVYAPPANPDDYARFVAAFVRRYGDRVQHIQIWDNPNVHPFWGRRNADPFDYVRLLHAGANAARAANPQVKILSAGLAPNSELIRGHPDYSDVLFLRGVYEAGARADFDIVAAKPYGMWSGPDDRRVDKDVFNFSRAILLRDEMLAYGDADKPMWAVEFGWNALPQDWQGAPSPWGTDTEQVQSDRLTRAVQRVRSEWAWMPVLIAQTFQPNAPSEDPLWGFALVDRNLQPRSLYAALIHAIAMPVQPAAFDFTRFYVALVALGVVALVALWRGMVIAWELPWERGWHVLESRFIVLPELAQFATLVIATLALYYSPNSVLNFALLVLLTLLFALRLDFGLAITVFTIPFYLFPKNLIGGMQFSMVEMLTLMAGVAWGIRQVSDFKEKGLRLNRKTLNLKLEAGDWAVLCVVLLGLLSVKTAANFGVAMREFRVALVEPALLYALIRFSRLTRRDLWRLVDAFILSALAVSFIGLYQFFFTQYVIVGEGVRRVLAVYGSPNNLALLLDRALPMLMAFALFMGDKRRRRAYALVLVPVALCSYLTYSRGSWLFGLPAGLLLLGLMSGRRARIAIAVMLFLGIIVLIPFSQTERFQSFFQTGTGTGFFRVSVWESAIAMIRDHPIFGVGLDNFLYEYPKYINPEAWREPNLSHPHNIVLDFWVRLGVLGVAALAWLVFEFYRAGWRKVATDRALVIGLMASMTVALAHGMIDAAFFYVDLAFLFMVTFGVMMQLGDSAAG